MVSSPVGSVSPPRLLSGARQQGPVARDAERVVAVREVVAAGTDADSLLGRAVGYGHPRSHGDSRGRPIRSFRRTELRSLHANSGLLIKSSSQTLWDVSCAWVPPFPRDGACRVALACLIGRAGHRWPGAPFWPCPASGNGGPLAAPAHSRQQGRRETPDRCFSTPPLTRNGCTRAAAAAVRCPNGCIPFEKPARSGSAPLLDDPIL